MNSHQIPFSPSNSPSCARTATGTKQRVLCLLAGAFTLVGTVLMISVNSWFALVPAVVGANQLFMSATGWCPMSKLLDHVLATPAA